MKHAISHALVSLALWISPKMVIAANFTVDLTGDGPAISLVGPHHGLMQNIQIKDAKEAALLHEVSLPWPKLFNPHPKHQPQPTNPRASK